MGRPHVTEAGEGDVEAIAAFFWAAWAMTGPEAPGWAGASEETMRAITDPDALRERVGGPSRRMFLAWDGQEVVGFSATRADGGEAELAGIVVREDRTGRGLGGPLLEAAVEAVAERGAAVVVVKTEAANDRALGFYEHHGFTRTRTFTEDVEGTQVEVCELRYEVR
ncbi:MAG: GNAT family N-acetyltransferase [Actinobacteria bacterium]|nr:GNAT family N-acetyltransferase [Actinomycetota bacterium]